MSLHTSSIFDLWIDRVGRFLLACLFLLGAGQKLLDPTPATQMVVSVGLPATLIWGVAAFNLGAGIMLILGLWLRPLALTLAAYCLATSYFHFIPADGWQMSIFVKNWAIAGGLLCLAAHTRPTGTDRT